jgi:hypothetical protein
LNAKSADVRAIVTAATAAGYGPRLLAEVLVSKDRHPDTCDATKSP